MNLFIPILVLILFFCNVKKEQKQETSELEKKVSEMLLLKHNWSEGDVSILRNKAKIQIVPGLELDNEDIILTGDKGFVELLFGIEESIIVGNNSELSVTNLLTIEGKPVSSIKVVSGTVLTILSKEQKDNQVTVLTPNGHANFAGSILLTQVLRKDLKQKNLPCDINSCITKFIALQGTIPIKQTGSPNDVILEAKSQVTVSKEPELAQNMIFPLDKESLSTIKGMITFHGEGHLIDSKILEEFKTLQVPEPIQKPISKIIVPKKKVLVVTSKKPKEKTTIKKNPKHQKSLNRDFHKDKLKLDSNRKF